MKSSIWKIAFKDPKFWILLFFIIRLYGITNPPLETAHNWRQVTTNMYARNFLEIDNNILYARVDHAGDRTGITAKEFPIFNYLIYLVSLMFGFEHWYGRLINLIVSSLGAFFFYKLVKKWVSEKAALPALIIFLASIWFSFSRKIMPDTFSISLGMMALYFGLNYFKEGKSLHLLWYFILGSLSILSKIPAAYLYAVFILPMFNKAFGVNRKIYFSIASAVILLINGIWYFYWMPFVVDKYGFEHFPMPEFLESTKEIIFNPLQVARRFYHTALQSYLSFLLFIIGFIFLIIQKNRVLLYAFALWSLAFFIFMLQAGHNFYHHNYYIIPFAPVMAMVAGYGLTMARKNWIIITALLIISVEGIGNKQHDFMLPEDEVYKLELEKWADQVSRPDDLVAFTGGFNPQQIYFAHRKGWTLDNNRAKGEYLDRIIDLGCKYLFLNKKHWKGAYFDRFPVIFENEYYIVYQLNQ